MLKTELKAEILEVKTELKAEILEVKTELKAEIKDTKIDLLKWMIPFFLTIIGLIITAFFKH